MTVKGVRPRGRPKQRRRDTVNSDLRWLGLDGSDAEDEYDGEVWWNLGSSRNPPPAQDHGGERCGVDYNFIALIFCDQIYTIFLFCFIGLCDAWQ